MNESFLANKQMRLLGALVLLMTVIALGSYAMLNFEKLEFLNPTPATISVVGEGEVLAVPDIGQFSFSVTADAETATAAQETSATKMNDILGYLAEQGVEDKDIKTQNYNLYPRWKYEDTICPIGSYCPRERVQDGFEVTQTVRVKVRATENSGVIIAGVGERGATDISGLTFTIDDTDALQEEARAAAIEDAKTKAMVLADQLGVQITRLSSYYEESGGYNPPYLVKTMSMDAAEESGIGGGPDLPVGEETTTVRVNVTFEVK